MGLSTPVAVVTGTFVALPDSPLATRKSILVENCGPNPIWVSYDQNVAVGYGHKIAAGASREFPADILYATAETADQDGTASNCTIVSEVST